MQRRVTPWVWGITVLLAAVLAASAATRTVSDQALALSSHDLALGKLAAIHTSVVDVAQLNERYQVGLVDEATWNGLLDSTRDGLADLFAPRENATGSAIEAYQAVAGTFVDQISMGVEPSFEAVDLRYRLAAGSLATDRDALVSAVETVAMKAAVFDSVLAALVGLLLPLTVVVGYRIAAQRQLNRARRKVEEDADGRLHRDREDLLAGLSHELRTPLTGITGFADLLGRTEVSETESTEMIGLIAQEAADLSRKLDDIMAAARLRFGSLDFLSVEVDVIEAITDVLIALDGMDAIINVVPDTVAVADPQRLYHALRNLIVNARQHGGPRIEVSAAILAGKVTIEIVDNGRGLDPERVGASFAGFSLGGNAVISGSVGLGLSVARGLIEGMGGTLSYMRTDGVSRFVVLLPAVTGRNVRWSDLRGLRNA